MTALAGNRVDMGRQLQPTGSSFGLAAGGAGGCKGKASQAPASPKTKKRGRKVGIQHGGTRNTTAVIGRSVQREAEKERRKEGAIAKACEPARKAPYEKQQNFPFQIGFQRKDPLGRSSSASTLPASPFSRIV